MLPWVLLLLFLPGIAMAQAQYGSAAKPGSAINANIGCPWLSEGSAARALGGAVSVTVKISEGEGRCSFSRRGAIDSIDITVSKAALRTCPAGSTSLRGIGNEAATCRHGEHHGGSVEMISSRVRDIHFTVTLTTRGQKSSPKPDDPQNDALEQTAEQVAGNLY